MRALISGGGGFLGVQLAEELKKKGFGLRLLLRTKRSNPDIDALGAEIVEGDLGNQESLDRACAGMDVVFHTAGMISYNPKKNQQMLDTNVIGTRNIANAAVRAKVKRFIYTSSTAAIGVNVDPKNWMTEASPFNARPLHLAYFDTKYDGEQEVLKLVRQQGLDAVIVNPGSLLGPRDTRRYEKTYAGLIYKYNPRFLVHGGINYVDVRDAVAGHILALEKGRTGERYILGGENLTYGELVQRTDMMIHRKPPKIYIPKSLMGAAAVGIRVLNAFGVDLHFTPELVRQVSTWYLFVDHSKATRELGYKPRIVDEAIFQTIAWLKRIGRL
jgi:dihydroflavonol-4-reductase